MTYILAFLLFLAAGYEASNSAPPDTGEGETPEPNAALTVTVQWQDTHQTIHGFGASDAWSAQFVGKNWPKAKRNQMADWLFSREVDEGGQPLGIGLSIWRFNIGAGSAKQGRWSNIGDPWRRAEGFLQDDGSYDWSQQQGQRWFLQAAQDRGVSTFIGFANSPPVEMTRNGRANSDGGRPNLPPEQQGAFAAFLADVAEHFAGEGLGFDYVSPINEPQWDWEGGQEGSPYTNEEIRQVTEALSAEIEARGLGTEVELPEAGQINYLFEANTNRPERDNQIAYLFGEHNLQAFPAVAPSVAGHSYFTTWPLRELIRQREAVAAQIQATDSSLEYAMSEYCILADNEEIQGNGRDLGIDPALYVARVIHFDLTAANASSWQWWLGISPYDYKDGLVYIDNDRQDGNTYDSKLLWGLGNYSRFLRPGAVRLGTERSDGATDAESARGLMVSAYRSDDEDEIVVVAVNQEQRARTMQLDVAGRDGAVQAWTPYVTSGSKDLAPGEAIGGSDGAVTVPPRSIVTYVGSM